MRSLGDHLTQYATYHRDRRNIATHVVGIPMIYVAVVTLLSRPAGAWPLTPATVAALAAGAFYLRLDRRLGLAMVAATAGAVALGAAIARAPTGTWLAAGLGLFGVGWAIQFVGHAFEGRKPAFVDDLIGLLIGPVFVVAETAFALGLRADLHAEITRRAGPTRSGPAPLVAD